MRTVELSEDGADELVKAILRDSLNTLQQEMSHDSQHPEDRKYCKKMSKALIKVINHFSPMSEHIDV